MFDFKAGGIAAGAAFVVSFLISLASRVSFPALILRPLGFAVLFFGIVFIIYVLVSRFLPELLDETAETGGDAGIPGSRIDISEPDDPGEAASFSPVLPDSAAVPGNFAEAGDSEESLDDISGYVKNDAEVPRPARNPAEAPLYGETLSDLDQEAKNGYTKESSPDIFSASGERAGGTGAAEGDFLPDLDSLAGVFMPSSGENGNDTTEYSTAAPAKKPAPGRKGQKMEGDFNPKDLAAGIRTILNKED
jgi:hypothetical protein